MSGRGTVLVLNEDISGMNRFLFREIGKEWDLLVEDIPYPVAPRYLRMALTFHPHLPTWKRRLEAATERYHTSVPCFRARSVSARRAVARHAGKADIVLQIGGMFNGLAGATGSRRVAFASFNTTLAYREWPPWAPFKNDAEFRRWYEVEKDYYHQADYVICTNRYAMNSFVSDYGMDPAKLYHIGYGVNFDTLPDVDKTYDGSVALFVGFDFVRKGGPTVVDAFRRVRREVPGAKLRIIGPADLDEKYRGEGVEYLPPTRDRSAVLRHFTEATFFVMPSVCEPFGLVFLEAMACKNACIGSTSDAMPEIIEHGATGYLIEPGNTDQLAEYMKRLFLDRELARAMGLASYQRVREQFTWPVCGERVRALFRSITGPRSDGPRTVDAVG